MSKHIIDSTTLTNIANAIRGKDGSTAPIVVSNMATKITNIPSGVLTEKNITANGTYNAADEGADGFSKVVVDVSGGGSPDAITRAVLERTITGYNDSVLTGVGNYGFAHCGALTSVTIPACTSVGEYAFIGCPITAISLNECRTIHSGAFKSCTELKTVAIPKCNFLGSEAFRGCNKIENISLPLVTELTEGSEFEDCEQLASVSLPECTTISGSWAFGKCTSLTSISLPKVTVSGACTFHTCSALTLVKIPVCESIEDYAFADCNVLANVYLNSVSTVTTVETATFGDTPLTTPINVHVPSTLVTDFKNDTNWEYLEAQGYVNIIAYVP